MEQHSCEVEGCVSPANAPRDMCRKHYSRWYRTGSPFIVRKSGVPASPIADRFWGKVNKSGPASAHRPDLGSCWLWTAGLRWNGYGNFGTTGGTSTVSHKFAYELLVGPVPEGLQLDHLCRVRHCVNPGHLEAVRQKVNILRGEAFSAKNAVKTHCPQGHPYDKANTYLRRGRYGIQRICRTCNRDRQRELNRRKREAKIA